MRDYPMEAPDPFPDGVPKLLYEGTAVGLITGAGGPSIVVRLPGGEKKSIKFWGCMDVTIQPVVPVELEARIEDREEEEA